MGAAPALTLCAGLAPERRALADALGQDGFLLVVANDWAAALAEARRNRFDLVLVAESDPLEECLRFLEHSRKIAPRSIRLFLCGGAEEATIHRALEAGADDVVCPPHSVRAVRTRWAVLRNTMARRAEEGARKDQRRLTGAGFTVSLTTREVRSGERSLGLSGREFELLVRLMEADGDVVPRDELLDDIWGTDHAGEAVLDATVHRLRRRLGEELMAPHTIETIRGVGFRLQAAQGGSDREQHPG